MIMAATLFRPLVALLLLAGLAGCGMMPSTDKILPDKKVEYKKSKEATRDLEIPPDMTRSSINDELVIPDARTPTESTLSGFETRQKVATRGRRGGIEGVLPEFKDIELKRDGQERWLVIKAEPEDVWYKVADFWQENGILLEEQDPTVGIMVTDWIENRADIRNDFITDLFRNVFDGLYSASTRDQFRVRIEPGEVSETTELYLTQRGMEEAIIQDGQGMVERTVWNPRPPDPGLEAEMLRRLMIYMGTSEAVASSELSRKAGPARHRARLNNSNGRVSLVVDEGIDRTWRLTGVALDRVGFAVEDRDRTEGIYYVRYNDPMKGVKDEGMLDKLAFWRDKDADIDKENQYQVSLQPQVDESTLVTVKNINGEEDNSETARRILTLIQEQIR
jgi:outer membrane protein assembly factor BamC